jgi:hypothetical protein
VSYSDGNIWYTEDNAASIGIYEAGGSHSRAVFSGGHLRALYWLETRTCGKKARIMANELTLILSYALLERVKLAL